MSSESGAALIEVFSILEFFMEKDYVNRNTQN